MFEGAKPIGGGGGHGPQASMVATALTDSQIWCMINDYYNFSILLMSTLACDFNLHYPVSDPYLKTEYDNCFASYMHCVK